MFWDKKKDELEEKTEERLNEVQLTKIEEEYQKKTEELMENHSILRQKIDEADKCLADLEIIKANSLKQLEMGVMSSVLTEKLNQMENKKKEIALLNEEVKKQNTEKTVINEEKTVKEEKGMFKETLDTIFEQETKPIQPVKQPPKPEPTQKKDEHICSCGGTIINLGSREHCISCGKETF
jgi:vacuolar-type H+-ATPase subunit I/STV1